MFKFITKFKSITKFFKKSEESIIEESLSEFDGCLTNNTLAQVAVDKMIENLERKSISPDKIKELVRGNLKNIIEIVKSNKIILDKADGISVEVFCRDEIQDEFIKEAKISLIKNPEEVKETEGKPSNDLALSPA